ncbi:hypothetical protein FIBSPDRAFT_865393 [Athelia psychrophila]|uniref:BTB domain-containing protein n=1 Tax=Athelia psychrophila TaxID=1759441 RepID=A0A166FQP5_9AGAM|nr:hypothetical protein FIBSPDRAFT_865393 [Fibularhizoctonia sp. CBS 109695]
MTVFKIENNLFRVDRTFLDRETDKIPRGAGSNEDPIELEHIRPADFEILLDFLKLGCAHCMLYYDHLYLRTSIIAVCYILSMQRVQNHACETLSDQQKTLLDQQKALMD